MNWATNLILLSLRCKNAIKAVLIVLALIVDKSS